MKKSLAITLLVVGNILLTLGLGFAVLLIAMLILSFGIALDVILLTGHIVGAMLLQRLYERRGWLAPVKFWLCAAVPAAVVSAADFGLVMYLDSVDYFSGFFAGMGEFLSAFSAVIYSGAFALVLGAALLIKYFRSKAVAAVTGFAASVVFGLMMVIFVHPVCLVIVAAVHMVGAVLIQHFLERKTGLSAFRFWALAAAPAAIVTGISYLIETIIGSGYDIFTFTFLYCLPAAVVMWVILMLKSLVRRKRQG